MTTNQILTIVIFIYATLPILCALAALEASHVYERHARKIMQARETAVTKREQAVTLREFELGRRAHDVFTMIRMRETAIEDDTTLLQMAVWEEPAS